MGVILLQIVQIPLHRPPTAIDLSGSFGSPLAEGSEDSIDKADVVNFGSDDLASGLDGYTVVTSIDNSVADLESVVERDDVLGSGSQDDKMDCVVTDHATAINNLSTSLPPHKPKHFWEDNPFLNAVFGFGNIVDDLFQPSRKKRPVAPLVDLTADDPKDDYPVTKALKSGAKNPLYHSALRKGSEELETDRRHTYLTSWTSLVLLNVDAFTAFDVVRQNLQGKTVREAVYLTIGECLACKATSTVGKRLGSLKRFARFCDGLAIQPFPLSDTNMHAYVSSLLVSDEASATSGRSFLESIRFTCAMLGLVSLDPELVSKRVDGVAQMILKRAPPIAQADPLTVKQVKQLEAICCNCDAIQDRVIAGGVLLMVYGSARASDVTRAVEMVIDKVPIECRDDDSLEPSGYIELKVLRSQKCHPQEVASSGSGSYDFAVRTGVVGGLVRSQSSLATDIARQAGGPSAQPFWCRWSGGLSCTCSIRDWGVHPESLGCRNIAKEQCTVTFLQNHHTFMDGKVRLPFELEKECRASCRCHITKQRHLCTWRNGTSVAWGMESGICCAVRGFWPWQDKVWTLQIRKRPTSGWWEWSGSPWGWRAGCRWTPCWWFRWDWDGFVIGCWVDRIQWHWRFHDFMGVASPRPQTAACADTQ